MTSRRVSIVPGQFVTLLVAMGLVAGAMIWYALGVEGRDAVDRQAFAAQVAEYDSIIRQRTTEIRAYTDSEAQFSRDLSLMRRAGQHSQALEAESSIVRSYQRLRQGAIEDRDLYTLFLSDTRAKGHADLDHRFEQRHRLARGLIVAASLLIASGLFVSWRWFGFRRAPSTGVAV